MKLTRMAMTPAAPIDSGRAVSQGKAAFETSMSATLASTSRERGPASTSTPYCVVTLSMRTEPSAGSSRNSES